MFGFTFKSIWLWFCKIEYFYTLLKSIEQTLILIKQTIKTAGPRMN